MSDEPIRLHDGTMVFKDGRIVKPVKAITVEAAAGVIERNVKALTIHVSKKLGDLPEKPRTMNGIAAVIAYTLFGLSDDDIASAIGCDASRLASIRAHDAYNIMNIDVMANVLNAEQGDIRELFVKHAREAVNTMVSGMASGKVSDRIRAAADILDRSGHRPTDVVEHRHRLEGGLTIEIVHKDERAGAPVIDLDVMENDHDV